MDIPIPPSSPINYVRSPDIRHASRENIKLLDRLCDDVKGLVSDDETFDEIVDGIKDVYDEVKGIEDRRDSCIQQADTFKQKLTETAKEIGSINTLVSSIVTLERPRTIQSAPPPSAELVKKALEVIICESGNLDKIREQSPKFDSVFKNFELERERQAHEISKKTIIRLESSIVDLEFDHENVVAGTKAELDFLRKSAQVKLNEANSAKSAGIQAAEDRIASIQSELEITKSQSSQYHTLLLRANKTLEDQNLDLAALRSFKTAWDKGESDRESSACELKALRKEKAESIEWKAELNELRRFKDRWVSSGSQQKLDDLQNFKEEWDAGIETRRKNNEDLQRYKGYCEKWESQKESRTKDRDELIQLRCLRDNWNKEKEHMTKVASDLNREIGQLQKDRTNSQNIHREFQDCKQVLERLEGEKVVWLREAKVLEGLRGREVHMREAERELETLRAGKEKADRDSDELKQLRGDRKMMEDQASELKTLRYMAQMLQDKGEEFSQLRAGKQEMDDNAAELQNYRDSEKEKQAKLELFKLQEQGMADMSEEMTGLRLKLVLYEQTADDLNTLRRKEKTMLDNATELERLKASEPTWVSNSSKLSQLQLDYSDLVYRYNTLRDFSITRLNESGDLADTLSDKNTQLAIRHDNLVKELETFNNAISGAISHLVVSYDATGIQAIYQSLTESQTLESNYRGMLEELGAASLAISKTVVSFDSKLIQRIYSLAWENMGSIEKNLQLEGKLSTCRAQVSESDIKIQELEQEIECHNITIKSKEKDISKEKAMASQRQLRLRHWETSSGIIFNHILSGITGGGDYHNIFPRLIDSPWVSLVPSQSTPLDIWTFSYQNTTRSRGTTPSIVLACELYKMVREEPDMMMICLISNLLSMASSCVSPVVGHMISESMKSLLSWSWKASPSVDLCYLAHHHLLYTFQKRFPTIDPGKPHEKIDISRYLGEGCSSFAKVIQQVLEHGFPLVKITDEHRILNIETEDESENHSIYFAIETGIDQVLLVKSSPKKMSLVRRELVKWDILTRNSKGQRYMNPLHILFVGESFMEVKGEENLHWFENVIRENFENYNEKSIMKESSEDLWKF